MRFYYCDTSALLRWSEAQVPGFDGFCGKAAKELERIIASADSIVSISEITLAEFQSNIYVFERSSDKPHFTVPKGEECLEQLMKWIDNGQIEVLNQPTKLIEKALSYSIIANRYKGYGLRAWDAAHIMQACEWSRSINAIVIIISTDPDFKDFLAALPEMKAYINVYDPGLRKLYS
jgi:predicted nucleic acid-binding protein